MLSRVRRVCLRPEAVLLYWVLALTMVGVRGQFPAGHNGCEDVRLQRVRLRGLPGVAVRREALLATAALAVVLVVLYWPAASLQGVFYVGDIYRLGYPERDAYARALQAGRVPLWTPDALAGYPIHAEGQAGAYYPLNLLLYRFLPLPAALNYTVLLAFWIAGVGTYAYARRLGLSLGPGFLSACGFMLGGFLPGHLNHLNMLTAVAWLPWLLWAVERATVVSTLPAWGTVAVLFGVQGLAGHPQISLMSALLVGLHAIAGPLSSRPGQATCRRRLVQAASCFAALTLGGVLAMVQWAPTYELTQMSQRGQGLDREFFTSFSLHPLQWVTVLWPFVRGNPFPLTSLETIGYVGVLPVVFAVLAPLKRRDRLVAFWGAICGLALLLTLGRWNPAYDLLLKVPVLNMFRAPARYLLWFDLSIMVLAGVTAESLLRHTVELRSLWMRPAALAALGLWGIGAFWLSRMPVDDLVTRWRVFPVVSLLATILLVGSLHWRPSRELWLALVVGLLIADLYAFNGVYNSTYNDVMAPSDFSRPPRVREFLQDDAGPNKLFRVYTHEGIVPVLPVMRESLYPNMQMLHGVQGLNGYFPLVPSTQQWLLENLNAQLADLLNVRYVLIPQVLPVDEDTEFYDTEDPLAPSIVGRAFDLPLLEVAAVEVEGYLSHSADLADGTPVGEIALLGAGGEEQVWTLRAGDDLAEWAYGRDDVQKVVRHRLPATLVRTWPARSGFPPRDHTGYTYLSRHVLAAPVRAARVEVRPLVPRAYLRVERLRLIDPSGEAQLLSSITGEGDHVLVYRSPDVAIYRNEGAGPRAFVVHRARVVPDEQESRRLVAAPGFDPYKEAILAEGRELHGVPQAGDRVDVEEYRAEYVRLRATVGSDAYLVLADSWYPGWHAFLDGRPADIARADVVLRAVALPPGEHVVEFRFMPLSWRLGSWVSGVAWISAVALLLGSLLRARWPGCRGRSA